MPAVHLMLNLCIALLWSAPDPTGEKLDRGTVALPCEKGVYVGWRLLASDPPDVAFHVYRATADAAVRLTTDPVRDATGFIDTGKAAVPGARYSVRAVIAGREEPPGAAVAAIDTPPDSPCRRIALQGNYAPQKVAIADLDGDGAYDFVIKQPNFNVDPFQQPGYWKKSPDTFKLEAYRSTGEFMWRFDLGWAIEEGIWYSPFVAYDLDGDGRAEVYAKGGEGDPRDADGRVTAGPEWLLQIDGATGQLRRKLPWPDRSGYEDYNWSCRNLLGIAFLDGRRPHLLVQRGTYSLIKIDAYGPDLTLNWHWNSRQEKDQYKGSGTHGMHAADVDQDGRDEIVLGSAVVDDNGKGLWTNPMHHKVMSHPDVCYVGDIDPAHAGLEIFYGFETGQPRDGVCLADARTGRLLWAFDGPVSHVHNQGMVADIIAEHPGQECYAGEKDGSQYWLYTAAGRRIGRESIGGLSPRPVWWNADPQKQLILSGRITPYQGTPGQRIEGDVIAIADCLGDWREEIVTGRPGELRVYSTNVPARARRVCLMQDRLYRLDVALVSMGYFYPPQLGLP
jgi:rhamnogalacturonan endolyase